MAKSKIDNVSTPREIAASTVQVFRSAASNDPALNIYPIDARAEGTTGFSYLSFAKPTSILVSRWYPGYRVTDLTGPNAEEAIAIMLGSEMTDIGDLEDFRRLLSTPGRAARVIQQLFPRTGVPIKPRQVLVSEEAISRAVKDSFAGSASGSFGEAAITAFAYSITRVLAAKGLVSMGEERRIVRVADSFAVNAFDLRRIIIIEAMRGIFSESRIQMAMKQIDGDVTPAIMGEKIGDMFRHFAFSIPEIKLRLEQFDMVVDLIRIHCVKPELISNSLAPHPALGELASMANFILYAADAGTAMLTMPAFATDEIKTACNEILTVIQSAPSIELLSMSRYAEMFGEVPCSSPDGVRRGLVLFAHHGQTSKMEVVDVNPQSTGSSIALVDAAYIRAAGLAAPLTGSLLSLDAMVGIANIVADELAMSPMVPNDECSYDPTLLTIQVSNTELIFLAMARAQDIAFTNTESEVPGSTLVTPRLLYGCQVSEQWRMNVTAATPSTAFFFSPEEVIVYTSSMLQTLPKSLPTRSQSIGAAIGRDFAYVGPIERHLAREVGESFNFRVPVNVNGASEPLSLILSISVMGILAGNDGKAIDRGESYYAAVKEPGVDAEISTLLKLALAYAETGATNMQGDKARAWLVVNLAPMMMQPAIRIMTERAVNIATIQSKLDARRLAPQMREVYTRAMFGTALAVLNRFGKLDGDTAAALVTAVPVSTLSLKAGLTLAQIPASINGSTLN